MRKRKEYKRHFEKLFKTQRSPFLFFYVLPAKSLEIICNTFNEFESVLHGAISYHNQQVNPYKRKGRTVAYKSYLFADINA
jgi:hypothetical protein